MPVTLTIGRRFKGTFDTTAAAQVQYCTLRDESGEGASTFPDGSVVDGEGNDCRISYNGRLWTGKFYSPDSKLIAEAPGRATA